MWRFSSVLFFANLKLLAFLGLRDFRRPLRLRRAPTLSMTSREVRDTSEGAGAPPAGAFPLLMESEAELYVFDSTRFLDANRHPLRLRML
ncbi:hypothetical protein [Nitrobacter sp.]|uniref:hypothetical protein n=1 Tax=Nitrobacter sp. TaxID=29420 RepID=UPI0029CAB278|nr:hypothetical protein [Nitrobacter sp.]